MNLIQLTSRDLKRITMLLERKEALQAQVAEIDGELAAFEGGAPASKPGRKPAGRVAGAARRGGGRFISAEGRRSIAEAQRARWAKKRQAAQAAAALASEAVEAKPAGRKSKAGGRRRAAAKSDGRAKPGQFRDKVVQGLKEAGATGIKVGPLAAKLGVKAQRVYVWLGGSGKSVKEIKRLGPGTYAWVE